MGKPIYWLICVFSAYLLIFTCGFIMWNSLPTALAEAESLHDFKLKFLAML